MLSTLEQLNIIRGAINPPGTDLGSLILQTGVNIGMTFIDDEKTTTGNEPATRYQNKIRSVASKCIRNDENTIKSLIRVFVTLLGRTNTTYTQIENATISQWESFASNQMLSAFEYYANVTLEEKFEFDNLPA